MRFNLSLVLAGLVLLPAAAFAQSFEPLVGIPGLEGGNNLSDYLNALYRLSITIAALLAVLKIVLAGVKYMFSDIVTQKADAKNDIRNALLGLLVVIGAVIILSTINSDLTNFRITLNSTRLDPPPDKGVAVTSIATFVENANANGKTADIIQCREIFKMNVGDTVDTPEETPCEVYNNRECLQACKSICLTGGLEGFIEEDRDFHEGALNGDACAFTSDKMQEMIDRTLLDAANAFCPDGPGNCEALFCNDYTNGPLVEGDVQIPTYSELGDDWGRTTCAQACKNIDGTFVEKGEICVIQKNTIFKPLTINSRLLEDGGYYYYRRNGDGSIRSRIKIQSFISTHSTKGGDIDIKLLGKPELPKEGVDDPDPNNPDHWEIDSSAVGIDHTGIDETLSCEDIVPNVCS